MLVSTHSAHNFVILWTALEINFVNCAGNQFCEVIICSILIYEYIPNQFLQRIWYNLYSATNLEGRYPCFRLRGDVGGVTSVELWRLNLYWSRKYVEYQRWVDTLRLQYCLIYCVEYHYQHAAWRGDDVFLDCTNPRLSLCGDIAACAWRLCCVKQDAICLEIYAGDCVDIIHAVDISILRALHCMLQWTLIFWSKPYFSCKVWIGAEIDITDQYKAVYDWQ